MVLVVMVVVVVVVLMLVVAVGGLLLLVLVMGGAGDAGTSAGASGGCLNLEYPPMPGRTVLGCNSDAGWQC